MATTRRLALFAFRRGGCARRRSGAGPSPALIRRAWLPASSSMRGGGVEMHAGQKATIEASGATAIGACIHSAPCNAPTRVFLRREGTAARGPHPRRSCGCSGGPRREKATIRRHQVSPQFVLVNFNCMNLCR
jgi:hypothetical protein